MKKKYLKLTCAFSIMLMILGCYPHDNVGTSEYDIVVTNYNKDFNYQNLTSFALPDSIVLITDQTSATNRTFLNKATAQLILNQIATNLTSMGWVDNSDDTANASVIILPTVFQTTTVNYYYPYSYWGWYYPGYYPGYGWGYPGYGGYPLTTSYQTGTLLMQMTYRKGIEAGSVPVLWTGLVNGLINANGSSTSSINARIVSDINQAFTQSPYLNIKK